jgi:hypothetical protein
MLWLRKYSVLLIRAAMLSDHRVEQGRCLITSLGEIHQGYSPNGTKVLRSQQLRESLPQRRRVEFLEAQ